MNVDQHQEWHLAPRCHSGWLVDYAVQINTELYMSCKWFRTKLRQPRLWCLKWDYLSCSITFRTADYYIYDPFHPELLDGWHLDAKLRYQPLVANNRGWFYSKLTLKTINSSHTNPCFQAHPGNENCLSERIDSKRRARSESNQLQRCLHSSSPDQ